VARCFNVSMTIAPTLSWQMIVFDQDFETERSIRTCRRREMDLLRSVCREDVAALRSNTTRAARDAAAFQARQPRSLGCLVERKRRVHFAVGGDESRDCLRGERECHGNLLALAVNLHIHQVGDGEGRGGDAIIDEAAGCERLRGTGIGGVCAHTAGLVVGQ
jgi:hypothetical protein